MPTRTVHCSICGKAISGYDFSERMDKLRRHRTKEHPGAAKASTRKGVATRRRNR